MSRPDVARPGKAGRSDRSSRRGSGPPDRACEGSGESNSDQKSTNHADYALAAAAVVGHSPPRGTPRKSPATIRQPFTKSAAWAARCCAKRGWDPSAGSATADAHGRERDGALSGEDDAP